MNVWKAIHSIGGHAYIGKVALSFAVNKIYDFGFTILPNVGQLSEEENRVDIDK
jgi:hypothetical protein